MRAIAVVLLLGVVQASGLPADKFYIGTIDGNEVHVILRDGDPILGTTWWPAEEPRRTYHMPLTTVRLVTGTHEGDKLVLREWDDGTGPERSLIEARFDGDRLVGTWRKHGSRPVRFELEEGDWTSDLVRGSERTHVPFDRLHAAIRGRNWPVAMHYAQLLCALSHHDECGWIDAIAHLEAGTTPQLREGSAPWQGLVLEREGRVTDAINWWRVECWMRERISCAFLAEYFPPSADETRRAAILDAAHRGEVATVAALLREPIDLNAGEHPPLYAAVEARSLEIVILLLAAGADPNYGPGYYEPLAYAILNGMDAIAMVLLDHGAYAGESLWYAVYEGKRPIVRKILANGEHPDAVIAPAGSALTAAVDNGDEVLVRELLAHGANPTIDTKWSEGSAIDHARRQGRKKILRMLLDARKTEARRSSYRVIPSEVERSPADGASLVQPRGIPRLRAG